MATSVLCAICVFSISAILVSFTSIAGASDPAEEARTARNQAAEFRRKAESARRERATKERELRAAEAEHKRAVEARRKAEEEFRRKNPGMAMHISPVESAQIQQLQNEISALDKLEQDALRQAAERDARATALEQQQKPSRGDPPPPSPPRVPQEVTTPPSPPRAPPEVTAPPTTPGPSPGGGGTLASCFIATKVFGSPMAPEVVALRRFRDSYLIGHPLGERLVAFYESVSPVVAESLTNRPLATAFVRALLTIVVYVIEHPAAMLVGLAIAALTTDLAVRVVSASAFSRFRRGAGGT